MENFFILADAADQATPAEPPVIEAQDIDAPTEETITVIAEEGNVPAADQKQPKKEPGLMQFLPLILIFVVVYFLMFRGPRKKQQQQQKMVQQLAKNDRVQTIGGIIGTVIDVGDDAITIKIDESTNTKMKVMPSAISRVLNKPE